MGDFHWEKMMLDICDLFPWNPDKVGKNKFSDFQKYIMLKTQALKWYITCHNCSIFSLWKLNIFLGSSFVSYGFVTSLFGCILLSVLATLSGFCGNRITYCGFWSWLVWLLFKKVFFFFVCYNLNKIPTLLSNGVIFSIFTLEDNWRRAHGLLSSHWNTQVFKLQGKSINAQGNSLQFWWLQFHLQEIKGM